MNFRSNKLGTLEELLLSDVRPAIIAELSGNHNGSIDRAIEIIRLIAGTGVRAVKLQTYKPETITIQSEALEFRIGDPGSLWHGRYLFDLYEEAHTPWEWHEELFAEIRSHGMVAFSSPFDFTAVDFLENLGCPAYKIASFEITHIPLIRYAASTKKPLIISTGMASEDEIEEALNAALEGGANDVMLLKCTSSYPATPADANLLTISDMQKRFHVPIGLSDHTLGIGVAVAAAALGAQIIEKHVTLDRRDGGVDSRFSLEPHEFALLSSSCQQAWEAIGKVSYGPSTSEQESIGLRRSIYVTRSVRAGDEFSTDNLQVIRPSCGLHPRHYDSLLSMRAQRDIEAGTPTTLDMFTP